ncbi:MAG: HipA domain-containing protein, partial [Treponema sp.]|nr:HipA domain-containing protein [Treponema sp.]
MRYTLMHRTIPVASIHIDDVTLGINKITEIFRAEHMPLGVLPGTNNESARQLNAWWMGRAIPASRSGLREALEIMHISSPKLLLVKCFGLSLSDQYWVRPDNKPLTWESVNFFHNDFSDDVGNALFGRAVGGAISLSSPDNTSDGWLKKKWVIADGKRMLLKGGSGPYYQEPFNEAAAASLMERLGIPHAPYSIAWDKGKAGENAYPLSVCEDFVSGDTELISAWHILSTQKKPNHLSYYQFFLHCCEALGIPGMEEYLDRLLAVDFLTANTDRHYNNFGALRKAETLEWLGPAPVFDTGTSLWHDQIETLIHPAFKVSSKPFKSTHEEQIKLVRSFDWLDFNALKGIDEE